MDGAFVLIAARGFTRCCGFDARPCRRGSGAPASFFNTAQIIKRAVARRNGDCAPLSEALASRMIQICNAELVALGIIPLTATVMARGVLYSEDFPWPAEAALAAAVFAGLSFKYLREALTWEEEPPDADQDAGAGAAGAS